MKQTLRDSDLPPAVVLGMNLGGLGVTRSLAAAGVNVIAVHDRLDVAEMTTRRAATKAVLPIREPELIDGLLRLAEDLPPRPVLISTLRLPTLLISEHRERLEDAYRFCLPPHDLIIAAENKQLLVDLAKRSGVSSPRSLIVDNHDALAQAADLRYPLILKPADNNLAYMDRFKKAYLVRAYSELTPLVRSIWPFYNHLVAQEWIEGDDSNLFFSLQYRDHNGIVKAAFCGRKLLSWPPSTGATAACTAAPEQAHTVNLLANALLDHLGATGFCSVEFKRDPHSGEYFLIEPTVGRTDQQEEVATLNGVNIPCVGFCDQTGIAYDPPVQANSTHMWVNDIPARWARKQLRATATLPRERPNPAAAQKHSAYPRASDPLPGIANFAERLPRPLHTILLRLTMLVAGAPGWVLGADRRPGRTAT